MKKLSASGPQGIAQLLIPTNSIDGTCDVLVQRMKEIGQPFFRWNIDLWQDYETRFDGNGFLFSDPTGRLIDAADPDVLLLWRKPFTELMDFDNQYFDAADREQARSQMRQWLLGLVALMRPQGRVRLIEPHAERRLPKLYQLYKARTFFKVPRSHFGINNLPTDFGPTMIIKPLGDLTMNDKNVLYTCRVNGDELYRPYPWFVQEALVEGRDVTCVHIIGRSHFFECEFVRGESAIDWRVEINTETQSSWHALSHPCLSKWQDAVNRYMKHIGLHYGRLDFILKGDALYFLECNSNGQFGWLDTQELFPMHREFIAAALDPVSTVV